MLPSGAELNETKAVCARLKNNGIEARTFWKPVHLQEPYKDCPKSDVSLSENLWQRIITLPCSTNITEKELEKVIRILKREISQI